MSEFLKGFVTKLKPIPDSADGNDWALAERTLPEYITDPLPMCMFRSVEVPVFDQDGNQTGTRRTPILRMEVMNVLAWVMARRTNPVITLEEVAEGITSDNRRDLADDIWMFWVGVKLWDADEDEEVVVDDTGNPPLPELESPEPTNGDTSTT